VTSDKFETFQDILESFDNAMLITHSRDGRLRARPMAIAQIESESNLWFITSEDSAKVKELEMDPRVCAAFQGKNRFLSITGHATVSKDRDKIDEVWHDSFKLWFPDGKEDPSIELIQLVSEEGEFWDRSGVQKLKYLFEAGKAYVSGEQPEVGEDVNARVNL